MKTIGFPLLVAAGLIPLQTFAAEAAKAAPVKSRQVAAFVSIPDNQLEIPAQDAGLPYTRSSCEAAMEILKDYIALHELGRHAYVYGYKTRIDNIDVLRGEPVIRGNRVYVPVEFASVLALKPGFPVKPAPGYINKNVWVYDINAPQVDIPGSIHTIKVKGRRYADLKQLADAFGKRVENVRGLWLIGGPALPRLGKGVMDNLIVQFDTPEKYIDPDLATRYIPLLKAQGKWTDHVKLQPGDKEMLVGPETEWVWTPKAAYDTTGIDMSIFGGKVPAPGVWPRLLFSADDLPAIRARIAKSKLAQKSLLETEILLKKSFLDPATPDGKVFEKLAAGDTADLKWNAWPENDGIRPKLPGTFEGQKPGIYSSHLTYNAQALTALALYAMIKDDEALAKKTASATYHYYKLLEPVIDRYLTYSDSEFGSNYDRANGSTTHWRGRHSATPHMDYFFALDFNGRHLTPEQRDFFVQYIAKLTYGIRTGGGDGPRRNWRDINHVTWHLTHLLGLLTIEGLEGCDPEALASGKELVGDFAEWGVNRYGTMFESNGKSGGGMQFQMLSMIALARRGENYFAHPNIRRILAGQAQNMSPADALGVSSGSWSGDILEFQSLMELKSIYPGNKVGDYLLTQRFPELNLAAFNLNDYRKQLEKKIPRGLRLPGPSYPGFVMPLLYDSDWTVTTRPEAGLPLDFVDPETGILSSYSKNAPDAAWLHFMVRNNHYMGSGHHHADAGMFHFSSDKVNWITESPFQMIYDGSFHNQVLIDGKAAPQGPMARPELLGQSVKKDAAFSSADLSNSYRYGWSCQFMTFDGKSSWLANDGKEWTLARDPYQLRFFKGTERYKMRPWWPTGVFSNWYPNFQYTWNPVEYVYRTAGLVRGNHPYAVIADDLRKDGKEHLYRWTGYLGKNVWRIEDRNLPENMILLGVDKRKNAPRHHAGENFLRFRKKGEPALLVVSLTPTESGVRDTPAVEAVTVYGQQPPKNRRNWQPQGFCDRVQISSRAVDGRFRVLLIPYRVGDPMPKIDYDAATGVARIQWADQTDEIRFARSEKGNVEVSVYRDGKMIF